MLWTHLDTSAHPQLALPGQLTSKGRGYRVTPRTVALDPWSAEVLGDWRAERLAKDAPGEASHVAPQRSVIYTGDKALDSASARIAADQQVGKAVDVADLGRELGFSAGSLRLWAAARHVTGFATLITGADVAGIDPFALHRQVTRGCDRGRRR